LIAFLDANAIIYRIEGAAPFASQVNAALADAVQSHPNLGAAVSRLSWLECRIRPMHLNDHATLAAFDAFFARPDLIWIELTRGVVELAAVIRARHALRTPDASQAASCLQLGAEHLFFTGDAGFERVAGLNVRLIA
jgi:predicted nucleic acid-binding protein